MIRKKYKKCKEENIKDILATGCDTCILKIDLKTTSKVKNHFIYEVCYLDEGQVKQVPIVAQDITDVVRQLEPFVRKGISEQWAAFEIGSEEAVISRKNSKKN